MAMAGLDIADPPQALVDWLKPLGIAAGEGKLVDLTLAGAKPEIVAGTIERLLADDANDAAIFVVGSSAQFNPELAVEPLLKFARSAKPFAVALTPSAEKSLALLTAAGVPAFRHPESCAEAMAICLLRPAPQPVPTLAEPTRQALDALEAGRVNGFDERRAADFFGALGVPLAKALAIPDAKRVAAAVTEIGAPVVLKILSRDIAHKTEAGGVALGLPDGQTAALAAREMEKRVKAHSPHAKLDGFLIQKMERGLAEVILGFRRDPLVGPTVTVGLGGVLAEIYKDAATRLAPVDEAEARQMIDEVKGLATIRGYRNLPRGDVAELAKAIAAFSTLAHQAFADVSEAEVNPLLVKREGEGVVAVDGLVVLQQAPERLARSEDQASQPGMGRIIVIAAVPKHRLVEGRKLDRHGKHAHARPFETTHDPLRQGGDHVRVGDDRWRCKMVGQAHCYVPLESPFVKQSVDHSLEIAHMSDEEVRVFDEQRKRQPLLDLMVPHGNERHIAFLEEGRPLDRCRRVRKNRECHVDVAALESVDERPSVHRPDDHGGSR